MIKFNIASTIRKINPNHQIAVKTILELASTISSEDAFALIVAPELENISSFDKSALEILSTFKNPLCINARLSAMAFDGDFEDDGVSYLAEILDSFQPGFSLYRILEYLKSKDPGNKGTVKKIVEIMGSKSEIIFDDLFYEIFHWDDLLKETEITEKLQSFLEEREEDVNRDYNFIYEFSALNLGKAGVFNLTSIEVLQEILSEGWDDYRRFYAALFLQDFGVISKQELSNILFDFLDSFSDSVARYLTANKLLELFPDRWQVAKKIIEWILAGNDADIYIPCLEQYLESAGANDIAYLLEILNAATLERLFENNRKSYEAVKKIIFMCSFRMSYSDFLKAWNKPKDKLTHNLDFGFGSLHYVRNIFSSQDFKRINRERNLAAILINLKISEDQQQNVIAKRLWGRIFNQFFPDEVPSEINDIGDLERNIFEMRTRLGVRKIAIMLFQTDPVPVFVDVCQQISDLVHIGWITNQPVPFRSFHPESTNLGSAIQSWLDEISQE